MCRCFAMALKPSSSKTLRNATGSGAVYSMNSKPAVPIGFSQGWKFSAMAALPCMLCNQFA
ncbi:Uncharacterised protein [Bordetella pertussis]|nr:Uncharacterised protein [Bordetella pertussis]